MLLTFLLWKKYCVLQYIYFRSWIRIESVRIRNIGYMYREEAFTQKVWRMGWSQFTIVGLQVVAVKAVKGKIFPCTSKNHQRKSLSKLMGSYRWHSTSHSFKQYNNIDNAFYEQNKISCLLTYLTFLSKGARKKYVLVYCREEENSWEEEDWKNVAFLWLEEPTWGYLYVNRP